MIVFCYIILNITLFLYYAIKQLKLIYESIKKDNKLRLVVLFIIACCWRWIAGDDISSELFDYWWFPTFSYCLIVVVVGELSRRILVRCAFISPTKNWHKDKRDEREDKHAIYLAIFWAVIGLIYTVYLIHYPFSATISMLL